MSFTSASDYSRDGDKLAALSTELGESREPETADPTPIPPPLVLGAPTDRSTNSAISGGTRSSL
jgi:hypothetical protein